MNRKQTLTSLSTFTGLGGMDLGLEAAGFRTLASIEWDECARRSIKANRGDAWNLLSEGDIAAVARHLQPHHLGLAVGELDLVAGAPPCQPYSKAGQWVAGARTGLQDRRGQYLDDLLDLVVAFQPRAVVLENVRGFVQGRTSALEHIARRMATAFERGPTYRIEHRVLDASDHGVPQRRSRAIVVLTREDRELRWPTNTEQVTAWDAIGGIDFDEPAPVASGKWADLLPSIPEGENYLWHTRVGGGRPLFGYRTRYWSFLLKLAKNGLCWTLPAQPGPATGPFHWDSRPLRVQEMLRLQSFPAAWSVEGGSRTDQVRQVGNATPPLLAEAIGHSLRAHLGDPIRHHKRAFAIEPRPPIPPPERVRAVPSKYLSFEDDHPDHPGAGLGPAAARRNVPG